jgi:hypothetical protein
VTEARAVQVHEGAELVDVKRPGFDHFEH